MRKVFCAILVCAALLGLGFPAGAEGYLADENDPVYARCAAAAQSITASHIIVYDYTADTLLYSRTLPGGKLYPASTTKLFSTYAALQVMQPDQVVTVGSEASMIDSESSVAFLSRGQQLTVTQLVKAMLLPSGNDAAMVLAAAAGRQLAGDASMNAVDAVNVFVEEMNRQAEALGFTHSNFANPHGYHVGCHYTCVPDMIRIIKLALDDPTIAATVKTFQAEELLPSGQKFKWQNTNLFLNPRDPLYRTDVIGMKTGHTSQAGECLVTAFQVEGRVIVVGIYGSVTVRARYYDSVKLLDACLGK